MGKQLVRVNTDALSKLARDCRAADPEVRQTLQRGLRQAADEVADEARKLSGWSDRIPGSIRANVGESKSGTIRAYVRAGGAKAPDAAVFEHHGRPGFFRHPLFGNRERWFDQMARPFLSPALDHKTDDIAETLGDQVHTTIEESL